MKPGFSIKFYVKGDSVVGDLTINREKVECESLEELVDLTWKDYKEALRYIWKRLEADIKCESRPHENFHITCFALQQNGFQYNEEIVLTAFFRKRISEYQKMSPMVGPTPK